MSLYVSKAQREKKLVPGSVTHGVTSRVAISNTDESEYVGAVRQLAERAGKQDLATGDPLRAIGELQSLARIAQSNETQAAGIKATLVRDKQKLDDAQKAVIRHEAALEELRKEAGAQHANALPDVIRASQAHRKLLNKIQGHRGALANSSGNISLEEFIMQVQTGNLDLVPAELERTREEIFQLEDAKVKLVSERDGVEFQLREKAKALNNAACEKFSAAARIDALATEYLEQQLGAMLLAKAMTSYPFAESPGG